jgi:hypothetical protein
MKKFAILSLTILLAYTVKAQGEDNNDPFRNMEFLRMLLGATAVVAGIYFVATFILNMIRLFLDYKLKVRMMDKGVHESIVSQFLQPQKKDSKATAVKWAIIVAGIGFGFALIMMFPPFGIHSIMLMSFCLSLSFLVYYQFTRKSDKL